MKILRHKNDQQNSLKGSKLSSVLVHVRLDFKVLLVIKSVRGRGSSSLSDLSKPQNNPPWFRNRNWFYWYQWHYQFCLSIWFFINSCRFSVWKKKSAHTVSSVDSTSLFHLFIMSLWTVKTRFTKINMTWNMSAEQEVMSRVQHSRMTCCFSQGRLWGEAENSLMSGSFHSLAWSPRLLHSLPLLVS